LTTSIVIPPIAWDDFLARADTGDVVLFSGDSAISRGIEVFTLGTYSHTSMVVVRSDGSKWLWQAAPEVLYPDPVKGKAHSGAQLGALAESVAYIYSLGDTPTFRQLQMERTAEYRQAVESFIEGIDGRPFPSYAEMGWLYIEGLAGAARIDGPVFCSMLIALTYQNTGLLPSPPPANSYCPTDFSDERNMQLQVGSFVVDQPIDMTGVPIPPPPTSPT
jgi:hypothetical protein